jgi:hypothetical protein
MKPPPRNVLLHGRDLLLPEPVPLRAGPLSLLLEGGDLKYVCLRGREVLRRVYAAVRDRNWGTVLPVISSLKVESRADSFRVSYLSEHRQQETDGEIDFAWRGAIEGSPDGTIRFLFDGETRSTFLRSRIGFCVLHPLVCAGGVCLCEHADGSVERGRWPRQISPLAPFKDIRALSHEVFPGLWAHLRFEGEVFEMEDHRNWTDASYKTFCTPLSIPYPVEVKKGTRIEQSLTLRLEGKLPAASSDDLCEVTPVFSVGTAAAVPLPRLGLGVASHGKPLSPREASLLKALDLSHLRVDLKLSRPGWEKALRQAWSEASALGARLEAAIFLTDRAAAEIEDLARAARELGPQVGLWLIFHEREKVTMEPWVKLARNVLKELDPEAKVGSGTNVEFVDVNRERPPLEHMDAACYSMSPQVHAFDNDSLVETLEAQGSTVQSAREVLGGLPLAITPVTLKRRFNPEAMGPEPEPAPGELPAQVDPRQMSLFGAAWTAGSMKYLAEGGVASATYYETTGWRGVLEGETGSPLPAKFPSLAGSVFPLYHVLADAGELRGGEVLPCRSSDPLKVDGLALRKGSRLRVLLANMRPETQRVKVEGLKGEVKVRFLDERSIGSAMMEPEKFRMDPGEELRASEGRLELEILPYAVARMDSS